MKGGWREGCMKTGFEDGEVFVERRGRYAVVACEAVGSSRGLLESEGLNPSRRLVDVEHRTSNG